MVRSSTGPKVDRARAGGAAVAIVDLFDPPALKEAVAGHDAVVNLATRIPTNRDAIRPSAWDENSRIRSEGSRHLVDAALDTGATRYVQESIAFAYPDHGDRWLSEDEAMASSPFIEPLAAAEAQAGRFSATGGAGVVLRFGNFYGPDSGHTADLVRFARRGRLVLPGRGDAYWPFVHLDDAAEAVVAALDVPPGTYHVADDEPVTRRAAADAMAASLGRPTMKLAPRVLTHLTGRRAPNMVASQRVSNRRLREASVWRPRYPSVREGFTSLRAEVAP
jgi:nucleoside-diphosphate-sugar epimerase